MRLLLTAGLMLACGVALAAPIPKEKDKPVKDDEAIQATWELEKYEGMDGPPPGLGPIRMMFKDGKVSISLGDRMEEQGSYLLNSAAKVKEIDLTHGMEIALGIYELDGDTLRICINDDRKQPRPTEFKSGKTSALLVLKRVKDEKKEK